MPNVNLLVATEPDAHMLVEGSPSRGVLEALAGSYAFDAAVMTLDSEGPLRMTAMRTMVR